MVHYYSYWFLSSLPNGSQVVQRVGTSAWPDRLAVAGLHRLHRLVIVIEK